MEPLPSIWTELLGLPPPCISVQQAAARFRSQSAQRARWTGEVPLRHSTSCCMRPGLYLLGPDLFRPEALLLRSAHVYI